jgi:hypothetical protein
MHDVPDGGVNAVVSGGIQLQTSGVGADLLVTRS